MSLVLQLAQAQCGLASRILQNDVDNSGLLTTFFPFVALFHGHAQAVVDLRGLMPETTFQRNYYYVECMMNKNQILIW